MTFFSQSFNSKISIDFHVPSIFLKRSKQDKHVNALISYSIPCKNITLVPTLALVSGDKYSRAIG